MASVMLFCTAEEAKPFLPEIMKPPKSGVRIFGLVESLTVPKNMEEMRNELHEGEPIHSPFIGASEDECESWAQEINYPVTNIIAIADARTGQDGTILICYHSSDYQEDWPNFGGSLPPQQNTWYNWRIKPEDAEEVVDSFLFGDDLRFPTYFGMKEQLTDENGVFNAGKAAVYMGGKDPETGEKIDPCDLKPRRC